MAAGTRRGIFGLILALVTRLRAVGGKALADTVVAAVVSAAAAGAALYLGTTAPVRFVEEDAAAAGRGAMQLEVLESQPIHPHLSRVREWYERRGYRETSRIPLVALYPEDAARLLVPVMDVVTMRKPL